MFCVVLKYKKYLAVFQRHYNLRPVNWPSGSLCAGQIGQRQSAMSQWEVQIQLLAAANGPCSTILTHNEKPFLPFAFNGTNSQSEGLLSTKLTSSDAIF